MDTIQKCLDIGDIIRQTGVPNYAQARITLKSGFNLDKWEQILCDYLDLMLLQYLKFGFPLSLTSPAQLDNTQVKNHYSATQYPVAIQEYLHKETQLGAILGPTPFVDSKHFHCSLFSPAPRTLTIVELFSTCHILMELLSMIKFLNHILTIQNSWH